jgi:cellobiose-specific phosphotransferase system component IIA
MPEIQRDNVGRFVRGSNPTEATPPPRSPERQRLAEAIQAHSDAIDRAARVNDAQQRVDDQLFNQLQPAVRAAQKAIDEAHAIAPEMLIDSVLRNESVVGGMTVAQSQAALAEAEQKVAEARLARALLAKESERAQIAIGTALRELSSAVNAAAPVFWTAG